ncbi:MAG: hypothetical protein R3F46_03680 [bacterium]
MRDADRLGQGEWQRVAGHGGVGGQNYLDPNGSDVYRIPDMTPGFDYPVEYDGGVRTRR